MENKIGIYKITSPTGRIYIGQSVNIKKRFTDYRGMWNCKEQHKLYASFIKHGVKNHQFEVIEFCEKSELDKKEIHYIKEFNSTSKFHLNIKSGGFGGQHSQETKEKMRLANIGKVMSAESRLKMSEAKRGKSPWNKGKTGAQIAWNKGKKLSPEHIENTRKANIGRRDSEETKLKKSLAAKGKPKTIEHIKNATQARKRLNFINKQKNGQQNLN